MPCAVCRGVRGLGRGGGGRAPGRAAAAGGGGEPADSGGGGRAAAIWRQNAIATTFVVGMACKISPLVVFFVFTRYLGHVVVVSLVSSRNVM
jgi:hypothetical protein